MSYFRISRLQWREQPELLLPRVVELQNKLLHYFDEGTEEIAARDETKKTVENIKISVGAFERIVNFACEQVLPLAVFSLAKDHDKTILDGELTRFEACNFGTSSN